MSNDVIPAAAFVVLCAAVGAWAWNCRSIGRGLRQRHSTQADKVLGSPTRRKNGMDRFFSLAGFLFSGGLATLGDRRLRFRFLLLKLLTALIVISFLVMMISPMAIKMR